MTEVFDKELFSGTFFRSRSPECLKMHSSSHLGSFQSGKDEYLCHRTARQHLILVWKFRREQRVENIITFIHIVLISTANKVKT